MSRMLFEESKELNSVVARMVIDDERNRKKNRPRKLLVMFT